MGSKIVLHAGDSMAESVPFVALVTAGGIGAATLFGLALAALLRRQSRPYILVAMAFLALLGRSLVAALALLGWLSVESHHTFEHGLDVAMVALVVGAVYYARTTVPREDFAE